MSTKEIVKQFYLLDGLRNSTIMNDFFHDDIVVEWYSSKGFLTLQKQALLELADELKKTYHSSRIQIEHLLEENEIVTVHYTHHIKTIENTREEIILAHFMVIWELKNNKLYKGYQMSQLG